MSDFEDRAERSFYGDNNSRVSSFLKMAPHPPIPKDYYYAVKMPTLPKSNRRPKSFTLPKINLPNPATLINVVIIGAVGLGAYKLYQKFFGNDPIQDANDKGAAAAAKTFVSNDGATATALKQTRDSLANKGLVVSNMHTQLATFFHDNLNNLWVDHDKIVKSILQENIQTFRLVSTAYGTRDLSRFANSPAHLLNGRSWTDMFTSSKLVGTLKSHLLIVLTSSEQSKLSKYLAVIST
ncbi:hypothetical protein [Mucilaginibacter sp. 10B2]|uniref:hypothetical protein n=1 Tax=Mucilaginibacter sp. 10B2 TaxID=3048574 RepID=UPI002B239571|nr:hypothetical protein [Mucilaginibacter sp. 10B2]MEB0278963.1 hypothetical protein [Mucilaginibacter sp. 10B2]